MIREIALVLLIVSAGCLTTQESGVIGIVTPEQGVIGRDAGIAISSFYAEKNKLKSGAGTNLILEIENVGDANAEGITIDLVNTAEFTVSEPIYQKSLSAPDINADIPGDKDRIIWKITAPSVDFPVTKTIKASIGFDYSTELIKEIPVISADRERAGRIPLGLETISSAPVRIYILSEDPVILSERESTGTANFKIVIENDRAGTIRSSASPGGWCEEESLDCIDRLELEIISQDPEFHKYLQIGCEGPDGSLSFSDKVSIEGIKLWKGESTRIDCKINIDMQDAEERYLVLKSNVYYRYYYNDEIQLSIS